MLLTKNILYLPANAVALNTTTTGYVRFAHDPVGRKNVCIDGV